MFDINKISECEHKLICDAKDNYGIYLDTCLKAIELSWTITEFFDHRALYFSSYLSQSNKALYLALMSLLRNHSNQSYFNIRLSIESSIMACYELHRNDLELLKYCEPDDNYKKSVYKWLENNYENHSKGLEKNKKMINQSFMHSNLSSAKAHFKMNIENGRFDSMLFDSVDIPENRRRLVVFIQIILIQLSMYREVIEKYPLVELRTDFQSELEIILKSYYSLNEYVITKQDSKEK
ncbi:hypothetical protein NKT34_14320 [Paenibacillus polysaccharolyticus]|uniref:hypothetical protein n=1 Tax=Paenibacillus polysaccharolyticus TaxID=582692 RepID=UPI0020A1C67A|nr:hypothetical protein [Paenibacillus polysaccharolyticus]MCP1134477.1 hypothetical protein [Paenibacillus polysaccharolyticus]